MTKVLAISSSRADVGGMAPVWQEAARHPGISLEILLTGRHVLRQADYQSAMAQVPGGVPLHVAGADIGGGTPLFAAEAMGASMSAISPLIASIAPEIILVLGDRLDMVPAALACAPFGIALGHIHGGELTLGAVDDRLRHAVTKLAHLHFVSSAHAAARVSRMGEEPWRIHVVGAPGLDSLSSQPQIDRKEFLAEVGLPDAPFALMTVHPETNADDQLAACNAALRALDVLEMPVLATAANADMGADRINAAIQARAVGNNLFVFRDTLGLRLYANALRHAAVMIGNSSSGIIEAGLFGLPVVNIGRRQEGRDAGRNVVAVCADAAEVVGAARTCIGLRFDPSECSIYGDGAGAPRIVAALAELPCRRKLLDKLFFAGDAVFRAPWSAGKSTVAVARGATPEASGVLVTRSILARELREAGIKKGSIVCTHAALGQLGFVVGGARTAIEALIDVVGDDGTIVMPSFSGDLSDPSDWRFPPVPDAWIEPIRTEFPPYSPRLTPTRRMGAIAELFRNWPGVLRSEHPQSSFAAFGRRAEEIVGQHPLNFRFGPGSPLARLEEADATVLMLGAPWNTISIFYRTQADAGPIEPITRSSPICENGRLTWKTYEDIVYSNNWFPDAVEHLLENGLARVRQIGKARCLMFEAGRALPAVRTWRRSRGL